MLYDICSDSGWSRSEVDEMRLKPEELNLEAYWSSQQVLDYLKKFIENKTGYIVDIKKENNSTMFEFHHAMWKQMGYYKVLVKQNEKELRERGAEMGLDYDKEVASLNKHSDAMEAQTRVCAIPQIEIAFDWLLDQAYAMIKELEPMYAKEVYDQTLEKEERDFERELEKKEKEMMLL